MATIIYSFTMVFSHLRQGHYFNFALELVGTSLLYYGQQHCFACNVPGAIFHQRFLFFFFPQNAILLSRSLIFAQSQPPFTEKAMALHSSTLTWKIPWTEEPGRLQSMGSQRVRHDWATSLSLFTFMHWRRKWQPTPVFLPGESQGRGSLVGCCLWGRTESDTTEAT